MTSIIFASSRDAANIGNGALFCPRVAAAPFFAMILVVHPVFASDPALPSVFLGYSLELLNVIGQLGIQLPIDPTPLAALSSASPKLLFDGSTPHAHPTHRHTIG